MRTPNENRKGIWKKGWILLLLFVLVTGAVFLIVFLDKKDIPTDVPTAFTPTADFKPSAAFTPSPAATSTEEFTPVMTYEVLNVFPHDPQAFTQGLIFHEGYLYESTGLYGESSLRQVELETGEVLRKVDLPGEYFAEGLALYEDRFFQLTWREGTGFIYGLEDFSLIDQFAYQTEGWGLTHDDERLIMSDGTNNLYFLDPTTLQIMETLEVTFMGEEIVRLNELEYIRGEIYANIWQTDYVVRIDPTTGDVLGWIDLSGILPEALRTPATDVLNGIAYDTESGRLFVTGKRWPELYEIHLLPSALPFPSINN
ncbi:MAG TPA: glutaminyl-peptide cyclotransferase [Brevefilum sp.]